MKKSLLFLCAALPYWAMAQINFQKINYESAKQRAKAENKLVFLDFYADWCRPCKDLSAKMDSDPALVDLFNAFFVNVKINIDHHRDIASRFNVQAIPNLAFVDSTGTVVNQFMGAYETAETALQTTHSGRIFLLYQDAFEKKNYQSVFIAEYLAIRQSLKMNSRRELDILVSKLPADSFLMQPFKKILLTNQADLEGAAFDFLLEHREDADFNTFLGVLVNSHLGRSIRSKSKKHFKQVLAALQKIETDPSVRDRKMLENSVFFYAQTRDWDDLHEAFTPYFEKFILPNLKSTDEALRNSYAIKLRQTAAIHFSQKPKEKYLEAMQKWLAESITIFPSPELIAERARLLYRLGKHAEAVQLLDTALEKGRSQNSDVTEMESILEKMKANSL
jgi:thiol-disulfide isomerase/thioredoxin